MAIKTFTTGEVLTAADTNTYLANSGLVYITSVTSGATASSVTVSNCFSSTYDNYRIVVSGGSASVASDYSFQFSGITTSVYQTYGYFMNPGVATLNAYGPAVTTQFLIGSQNTSSFAGFFDVTNPNQAKQKQLSNCVGNSATGFYSFSGNCTSTSAATGCVLTPNAGTWNTVTVTIFGYRKA